MSELFRHLINKIKLIAKKIHGSTFLFLFFVINLFMVLSELTPSLYAINPHDGAKYIDSGRQLIIWGLRDLAWGPLVAFIYAPIYLFVSSSPHWFIIMAWAGNIILFGLLWIGFFLLTREFKPHVSSHVVLGILISSVVFISIIKNQSDALFVAMISFALVFLVRFKKTKGVKYVWLTSLFVGMGILSRVETVLLLPVLIFFSLLFNQGEKKSVKILMASVLPTIIVLSLFISASLLTHGHPNLGMGYKSFDSLEMNHAFIPGSRNHESYLRGEPIFGTAEENQGSVIRAILRNPLAIGERALANILRFPELFSGTFGNLQAPFVIIFSLWGIYALVKAKENQLLILLLLWPLHAMVSLIFLPLHIFPQMAYTFIILMAVGITYQFSNQAKRNEKVIFCLLSFGMLVFALLTRNKIAFSAGIVLLIVMLFDLFPYRDKNNIIFSQVNPVIMLLIVGLLFGNSFIFPARPIGASEEENAVAYLQTILPSQSQIVVPLQTFAIASKLRPVDVPTHINNEDDLHLFIEHRQVDAILVDRNYSRHLSLFNNLFETYADQYSLAYRSDSGNIIIYTVDRDAN